MIDANLNRVQEGLRVCEEVARFVLKNPALTCGFKHSRHSFAAAYKLLPTTEQLLQSRQVKLDPGRKLNTKTEFARKNCADIFFANIQRAKESLRVLEEFSKLGHLAAASRFKSLRYKVYELEKKAAKELPAIRHP